MFNVVSPLVVRHFSEANVGGDAISKAHHALSLFLTSLARLLAQA